MIDGAGTPTDPENTAPVDAFREAARVFFPNVEALEAVESSAAIVRVITSEGQFALRRWEPAATAARVAFVHATLARARAAGITAVPVPRGRLDRAEGAAALVGGRLFDAQSWLPGRTLGRHTAFRSPDGSSINLPLHPTTPVESALTAAAHLTARFHSATRELATHPNAPRAPLGTMLTVVRQDWQAQRRRLGPLAETTTEVRRWLRCGNRVIPIAGDRLRASPDLLHATTVVTHGDLWPAHLLTGGDGDDGDASVTGIVDWARAAAGSPLLDLAHLATHVAGWSAARAELVLGAYSDVAPLLPEQRRLLPVVAALDLLAEIGWLLDLGFADDRLFDDPALPFVRGGLKTLLTSLEALTNVLAPPEPRTGGRRWVPGPRRPRGSGTGGTTRPPRERSGRSPRRSRPRRPGAG